MRTLYLVRHAKSSWNDSSVDDFDRPLNERGKHDAPEMAKRLKKRKVKIDAFVSSPAKRARKTCKYFCEAFHEKPENIIFIKELYMASLTTFAEVAWWLDDKYKSAALFSHNPGITDYANSLVDKVSIDNMPTCSIFAVEADVSKWKDFGEAEKRFLFFDYPKLVNV